MNFVLIDDDPIALFLTKKILQFEGITEKVMAFDDPEEALEFLQRQIPAGELPQVILLDLNMPKISGWDLLEDLEPYNKELEANCLIYLLTSSLDPSDIAKAKEHPQVKGLIHKPLDRQKVQEIQKNMVEFR